MERLPPDPRRLPVERSDHEPASPGTLLADRGDEGLLGGGPLLEIPHGLIRPAELSPDHGGRSGRPAERLDEPPPRDAHRPPQRWQALQSVEGRRAATPTRSLAL